MTARSRTAVLTSVVGGGSLAVVGLIGWRTQQPWLFPSLGPTVMVLAETPAEPAARPRSVLVGHGVGIVAGWLSLLATGLLGHPSAVQEGITGPRVAAALLSLVVTAAVTVLLGAPHPPAGATTLLISLGILTQPHQLLVMAASILVLLGVALALRAGMQPLLPDPAPGGRATKVSA